MPLNNDISDLLATFRDRYRVPAIGGAIVAADGVSQVHVLGDCIRDRPGQVKPEYRWHIGSCGKSITAALYARLVERGVASWGTKISDLLPDVASSPAAGWSERTIDDIFTCRAGVPANLTVADMHKFWDSTTPLVQQRTEVARNILANPAGPRGRFAYSNLGYILAGAIIDRLSGQPFEEALQTHVFGPLGVTQFGFGPPPEVWGHKSWVSFGSIMIGRGAPANPADKHSDNPPVMNSAGRISPSISDWALFVRAFLRPGHDFLRGETIDHLFEIPTTGGPPMAMGWGRGDARQGVSFGMQGSNTMWAATAVLNCARSAAALVVCNDGRTRVLQASAKLAGDCVRRVAG